MAIENCKKFKKFVEENKELTIRRLRYEFEEKKEFILSMADINTVMEKVGIRRSDEKSKPLYSNLKSHFKLSDEDYDDIFQESVIALYNNLGKYITCTLSTYLFFICKNHALKHYRKLHRIAHADVSNPSDLKKLGVSSQQLNLILHTSPSEKIYPQLSRTPDEEFELSQMKGNVHKALNEMANTCKQLLTKYYIEGYSWMEIAMKFELKNSDSAKAAANRCRNRFKEKYSELERYVKQ